MFNQLAQTMVAMTASCTHTEWTTDMRTAVAQPISYSASDVFRMLGDQTLCVQMRTVEDPLTAANIPSTLATPDAPTPRSP